METDTPKARARLLKSVKIAATFDRLFVDGDRLSTASTGVKRRRRARALTVHTDVPLHVSERIQSVISECRKQRMDTERAQHTAIADNKRLCSDASLAAMTKFTDNLPLAPYGRMLHFVPRIVNVVRTVSCQNAHFCTSPTLCAGSTRAFFCRACCLDASGSRSQRRSHCVIGTRVYRSTCNTFHCAATGSSMHRTSLLRCSSPTTRQDAEY